MMPWWSTSLLLVCAMLVGSVAGPEVRRIYERGVVPTRLEIATDLLVAAVLVIFPAAGIVGSMGGAGEAGFLMLKRRVIIGLMFDDGVLVRTKRFVPDYRYTQEFLAVDGIDEALLVDVTRAGPSEASRRAMAAFADRCFAPVTMGGWISTEDDVARFFDLGSDKVVIGRAWQNGVIEKVAHRWGCQAAVVAVDVGGNDRGGMAGLSPEKWAAMAECAGAGEIYLQAVDRDGSLGGYDLPLLRRVCEVVRCPVTVGTGCGSWRHMEEAFEAGASGAVTTCVHHWTESALRGFKARLHGAGQPVRVAA